MESQLRMLMIAAQAGQSRAQAELLSLLAPRLRAFFGRRLGRRADDAEDLVQETLLAIHTKRSSYDPRQPFTPWLFAIARYRLIDHLRRVGRRLEGPLGDASEVLAEDNPEEGGVRRDVAKLLARLPGRQRALLRDVKLAGFSMEEAAGRAGMSVTAAKVSVHRSMRRLMGEVADEDR